MSKESIKNTIIETTKEVLNKAGFSAEVRIIDKQDSQVEANKFLVVSIESDFDMGTLIGKNGQNLSALEHLVRLMSFRKFTEEDAKENTNFIVDINDYKKSRTDFLISIAREAAKRVSQSQRAEALSPMSSYERRVVHMELASFNEIQTESIGEEPKRRIVIKPI